MNLEDRLLAWGRAESDAAGDPPALPLPVAAAPRRWLPLAAAAAVVAVAGGAVVLGSQDRAPRPDRPAGPTAQASPAVVPWADLFPSGVDPRVPLPSTTADSSVRECRAEDMTAALGQPDGGGGSLITYLELTNSSTSPCRLEGQVRNLFTRQSNEDITLPGATSVTWPARTTSALGNPPVVLAPGAQGQVAFTVYVRCDDGGAGATYGNLSLDALGGRISIPGTLYLGCAHPESGIAFGTMGKQPGEPERGPSPFDELTATIDGPESIAAGSVLHYTVTLHNPTSRTIALSPCPDFEQGAGITHELHALNCGEAEPIPAGGEETFAMEIRVDPGETDGIVGLEWALDHVGFVTASTTLRVVDGQDPSHLPS